MVDVPVGALLRRSDALMRSFLRGRTRLAVLVPEDEAAVLADPVELEQAVVVLYGFDESPLDAIRIIREDNAGRWALENGDDVLRIFSVEFSPQIDASQYGPG